MRAGVTVREYAASAQLIVVPHQLARVKVSPMLSWSVIGPPA